MSRAALRRAERATTHAQLVLHVLAEPDEEGRHLASVDGLGQLLRCGRGAVIAAVDELERIGFLERSTDRRTVELTGHGLAALREAKAEAERDDDGIEPWRAVEVA